MAALAGQAPARQDRRYLGIGVIAEALAPKCKAMGMTVSASRRRRAGRGLRPRASDGELLSGAAELDYLVLLTPYSPRPIT
jgi:phosphoglycerate dehydrogenase-like enzyme